MHHARNRYGSKMTTPAILLDAWKHTCPSLALPQPFRSFTHILEDAVQCKHPCVLIPFTPKGNSPPTADICESGERKAHPVLFAMINNSMNESAPPAVGPRYVPARNCPRTSCGPQAMRQSCQQWCTESEQFWRTTDCLNEFDAVHCPRRAHRVT